MRAARVVAVAVLASGLGLSAVGCSGQSALTFREVVVKFAPSATPEQHRAARAACDGLPHTSPEPIPSNAGKAARLNDVRFRVDQASDAELNALYQCLIRQPGVIGVDIPATQ